MEDVAEIRKLMEEESREGFSNYHSYLSSGVAREVARINLPLSTYTTWIWKIDLHNLFHFLGLRLHPHAQMEIRVYAEAMATMVQEIVPIAWEAFEDYRLNGCFLTKQDIEALRVLYSEPTSTVSSEIFPTQREYTEFCAKWTDVLKP